MAISSFTREMGEQQGRLVRPNPVEGSHVFVLGSTQEWRLEPVVAGDHVQVEQYVDLAWISAVRCRCRLAHPPASLMNGMVWTAVMTLNGSPRSARRRGWPGRERVFDLMMSTLGAPLGLNLIAVRLELVPA